MEELRIPDLGEGIEEGTVVAVRVAVGTRFKREQALLEIETDKVTLEIPAPCDGIIEALSIKLNDVVRPADIFARIAEAAASADSNDEDYIAARSAPAPAVVNTVAAPPLQTQPSATVIPLIADEREVATARGQHVLAAGPAARREARELGVDLAAVMPGGPRTRVTREDVRRHARARLQDARAPAPATAEEPLPDLSAFGPVHTQALTGIERATARNMARAAALVPQAWISHGADVTDLESARREFRAAQAAGDAPLTLTAVLCKVIALALAQFPRFNAAFDARTDSVIYRDYVNVGVAVDSPRGLLVPVIREALSRSIQGIACDLSRLSVAVRDATIAPADLKGGGITLTNLGGFGISALQPIVNWPEVAIVGVAASSKVAQLRDDGSVDARLHLPLTLGFDHRVINGGDAARFLAYIAQMLAHPAQLMFML